MNYNLSRDEVLKMKVGFQLMWQGAELLKDATYDFSKRTNYETNTEEFDSKLDALETKMFELEENLTPEEDFFTRLLHFEIVTMLASSMGGMNEIDEVNTTLEKIAKVISCKLTKEDKEEINEMLNWIEKGTYREKMKDFMFRKEFLDSFYFKDWRKEE